MITSQKPNQKLCVQEDFVEMVSTEYKMLSILCQILGDQHFVQKNLFATN